MRLTWQATLLNKLVLNIVSAPFALLLGHSSVAILLIRLGVLFGLCTAPKLHYTALSQIKFFLGAKAIAQLSKIICLQHVQMGFYQIARGLLLPFTVGLSILFLHDSRLGLWSLVACGTVTFGFLIGVSGVGLARSSVLGISLGVGSSMSTAVETVVAKKHVSKEHTNLLDLTYASAIILAPIAFLGIITFKESDKLAEIGNGSPMYHYIATLVASCVMNTLLTVAALRQIQITSPITHMISTAARGILQTCLAVTFLNESLSVDRLASIMTIVLGTCLYVSLLC